MKTHARSSVPATGNRFTTLDWPSPEMITAARRARGQAVREMTLDLCRRLKRLALATVTPLRSSREHPARPERESMSRVTRETLARAWLEN